MTNPLAHSSAPMAPAVSVVVPCYNQASFLPARFASIFGQSHAPAEVIVVDDASTDNTPARLAALSSRIPLHVHRNSVRNGQPCAQWQTGITRARHEWIWIAEADDASEPTFLATLLAAAARHPEAGFIYCQSALTGADGKAHGTFLDFTDEIDTHRWRSDHGASGSAEARRYLCLRNTIPNVGACLVRRDVWMKTVPLETSLQLCGDWLAYARLFARTDLAFVAAPLNRFRTHGETVRARTSITQHIAEGYRVRSEIAALHGLDDGERELAARFAAGEWLRLMPEAATLPREKLPPEALAAAELFDRDIVARLRDPARAVPPRVDIYHAEAGTLSEAHRVSCLIAPDAWRTVQFHAGPGALRLDPLNQPGRIEFRRLVVRETKTGRSVFNATNAGDFAMLRVGGDANVGPARPYFTVVSTGTDPQIFILTKNPDAPHLVELEARITLGANPSAVR